MASVSREQRAIASAEQALARRLGVGGGEWRVARATGDGVTTPVTTTTVAYWLGYVADSTPEAMQPIAPGATVGNRSWYGVAKADAVALSVADILTSVETPALRFGVAAVDLVAGYARYLLEPR